MTPDRALARRVLAALARWNVAVDDFGGDALADTPAGVFARLAAEAALGGLEPVTLLALLKHPLLRLGAPHGHAIAISVLERALAARAAAAHGTAGLAHALAALRDNKAKLHGSDPRRRLTDGATRRRRGSGRSAWPLRLRRSKPAATGLPGVPSLPACHREVIEALARQGRRVCGGRRSPAWRDSVELHESVAAQAFAWRRRLCRPVPYRHVGTRGAPPRSPHARVRIFGLLEARLQNVDRLVLGGLVEGVWPPETRSRSLAQPADAAATRPRSAGAAHRPFGARLRAGARRARGDPQPRGQARRRADRARRASCSGSPRSPARSGGREAQQRGARYRGAGAQPRPRRSARRSRIKAPAPKPPSRARPMRLERHRDRALAARSLHDLRQAHPAAAPLDDIDTPPGARDRGTVIHGAIGDFTETFADRLPDDPLGELHRRRRDGTSRRWRIFPRRGRSGGRASSASPAGSSTARRSAAPSIAARACRDRRRARDPARRAAVHADDARRPHRAARRRHATPSSTTRPARRRAPSRCAAGCAAAHARSRDPAARRLRRHSRGRLDRRARLCAAARRRAGRRSNARSSSKDTHPRRACRSGARQAERA